VRFPDDRYLNLNTPGLVLNSKFQFGDPGVSDKQAWSHWAVSPLDPRNLLMRMVMFSYVSKPKIPSSICATALPLEVASMSQIHAVAAQAVCEVNFCTSFSLQTQIKLSDLAATQAYSPGVQLFQQGCPAEDVYFIGSGLVKLTILDQGGTEVIVCLRSAGWILGATAVILKESHQTSAATLTRCQLQRVLAADLRKLLKSNPELSWCVHEIHSRELRTHLERLTALATQSARSRLTHLLSQVIQGSDSDVSTQEYALKIPLRQWEIAQLLAITPEHISRLLKSLERDGLVRRQKSILVISNPRRLIAETNCT